MNAPAAQPQVDVTVVRDEDALALMAEEAFQAQWQRLQRECPWGTVFQSRGYVETWYRVYRQHFEPLLVTAVADDGSLVGLLAAAQSKRDGSVVLAGAQQAEYQVWLAVPAYGDVFILRALEVLHPQQRPLTFKYLPPGTPIAWLRQHPALESRCVLELEQRQVVALDDPVAVRDFVKGRLKKWRRQTTRQRLDRLERAGEVRLTRLTGAAQLRDAFDDLIVHYDLKHGAAWDEMPFHDDPCKMSFYRALQQVPGLLHITALFQEGAPLAAHLGIGDQGTLHPLIMAYSLWHGKVSPFSLHLLMLFEQLADEGWRTFDLTPGDDFWKKLLATGVEDVRVLTVYPTPWTLRRRRMRGRAHHLVKTGVERCLGRAFASRLRDELRDLTGMKPAQAVRRIGARLLCGIWRRNELRLYRTAHPPGTAADTSLNHNRLADFLHFDPRDFHDDRRLVLSSLLQIVQREGNVYSQVEEQRLVAFSWWSPSVTEVGFGRAPQQLELPDGAVLLGPIRTARSASKGPLMTALISRMAVDALASSGVTSAYVCVHASDRALRTTVEQLGFTHVCSFVSRMRFFRKSRWRLKNEASAEAIEPPK